MAPEAIDVEHFTVLIHGFWGNPDHLRHVRQTLEAHHPEVYIFMPESNSTNNTYDGVEVCGERVAHEIEEKIREIEREGAKIRKFSIAGYSLGGLIARYAVGLLYNDGFFNSIQPVNFTTFASPHLGIRTPTLTWRSSVFNYLGARTLSKSGQQMFLIDNFRGTNRNLFSIMADPNSIFVKGLKTFKNKWIYANTMNDRSVPFWAAYISRTNPYVDIDKVKCNYAPGQEEGREVILDPDNPVEPQKSAREAMTVYQRITDNPYRTLKNIQFSLFFTAVLPLIVPLFLINAGYQTIQSGQRQRLHESGKAFKIDRYRTKLLEEAQVAQDRLTERIGSQTNTEYLPTPPPERSNSSVSSQDSRPVQEVDSGEHTQEKDSPSQYSR